MVDEAAGTVAFLTVVAAALIDDRGRVLLQRRPAGSDFASLWEFPGGKIEPGERTEDALIRELHEELGISVEPSAIEPATFVTAPLGKGNLLLLLFVCRRWRGEPSALAASALRWCFPADMHALAMPPADVPLVEWLVRMQRHELEARAGIEPACEDLQSST